MNGHDGWAAPVAMTWMSYLMRGRGGSDRRYLDQVQRFGLHHGRWRAARELSWTGFLPSSVSLAKEQLIKALVDQTVPPHMCIFDA